MSSTHATLSNALGKIFGWIHFTEDDEARERAKITPRERDEGEADVYGLTASMAACCVNDEDEDFFTDALYMLDAEIGSIPAKQKDALLEAQEKCPDLVGDDFKKLFVFRENFDAKIAARRVVDYWEYKRSLFGPEKCFLPLTLRGALKDDLIALSQGMIRVLPTKDTAGRAIIFWDPSRHDRTKYSRESMLRAIWYTFHALIDDDPNACKLGVILLVFPKHARLDHFDFKQYHPVLEFEDKYLPIRFRSLHICHPDLFFHIISPAVKGMLSTRTRQRLNIHYGSDEHVLQMLNSFGMPRDLLPSCLGGTVELNHDMWIAQRYTAEASPDGEISTESNVSLNLLASIAQDANHVEQAEKRNGIEEVLGRRQSSKSSHTKAGRKGDPRMNRAVQAKISNPHLTLLDALLEGGYVFPDSGGPISDKLRDADNVSLAQRKNQLMRRLRKLKGK